MLTIVILILTIFFLFLPAISYNQPKICPNASWTASAVTFADNTTLGQSPFATFVNNNNTVYVSTQTNNSIIVWQQGNAVPALYMSLGNYSYAPSLFVTDTYDLYVDNGEGYYVVDNSSLNSTDSSDPTYECAGCWGLFIDISNNIYCSVYAYHQVVSKSLNTNTSTWNIIAGTGVLGSTATTFNYPRGIFVDISLNLYVADTNNNRIQKFQSGQSNGVTVAGNGASGAVTLNNPTSVVLDADGNLFIVDSSNHRIIGSDSSGFRCIAGCSSIPDAASTDLWYPTTLSFDSYGNIFVTDQNNNRIQQFILTTTSCGKVYSYVIVE
jgi:hypothetical protein